MPSKQPVVNPPPPPTPPKPETSWLRNALLEILIIIVGILLSVIITEIFSNQKNTKREQLYLKELVQDLEDDLVSLELDQDLRISQLENVGELLQIISTNVMEDSTAVLVVDKLRNLSNTVHFNPNMATFRALESTGRVELIKSDKVVRSLITLYTHEYDQLRINNNDLNTYRNNFLLPYAVENFDFALAFGIGTGRGVWLSDSPDITTLKNHIIYNQLSLNYTVSAYKRAIFKARETLNLVNDELE